MRIITLRLKDFKRFHDLTIDLGDDPKKIIALVGPNGSGKSSVFDGLQEFGSKKKTNSGKKSSYYKKSTFEVGGDNNAYKVDKHITITSDRATYSNTSFYVRSAYRYTPRLDVQQTRKLTEGANDDVRPQYLIDVDSRLQDNYERLLGNFFEEVYDKDITGKAWSQANIDALNKVLITVLDIKVVFLGDPTKGQGTLYFEKGVSKRFPYEIFQPVRKR